jgi:2-dehydro-3-deoxyphosphogluconate aldolase / (4S)-4-hydroxy-2-oxoglutarate aldolase
MGHVGRFETVAALEKLGAVAVLRLERAELVRPVVDALLEGGVRAIEVTMTTRGALDVLAECSAALGDSAVIGAGTVLDGAAAQRAVTAGARFVVSPVLSLDVIQTCRRYDVVSIPGALSPTEIATAWEAGADVVKVFPGGLLGPAYLRELHGPLPHLRLMPTGGVTLENAADFIGAGAVAVGLGGALVEHAAVARRDFAAITERARRLTAAVRTARGRAA